MSFHHHTFRRLGAVVIAPLAALGTAALLAGCGGGATTGQTTVAAADNSAAPATSTGSGGGATSSGSDAPADVCSLLSAEQASSLTGKTFVTSKGADVETAQTCTYEPADASDQELIVTVDRGAGCWDTVVSTAGTQQPRVPGVGDAAYGLQSGLDVKHGSTCLEVTGDSRAESLGDWSADIAVAQTVIKGLG